MKRILILLFLATCAFAQQRVVDVTHTLGPKSPDWEGTEKRPFEARDLATFEKNGYFTRWISMQEHFSTHIDAPAHFSKTGWTVDQIPPDPPRRAARRARHLPARRGEHRLRHDGLRHRGVGEAAR